MIELLVCATLLLQDGVTETAEPEATVQQADSQEPEPAAPADLAVMRWSTMTSNTEGSEVVYRFQDLVLESEDGQLHADTAVLRLNAAHYRAAILGEEPPPAGPAFAVRGTLAQSWTRRMLQQLGLPTEQEGLAHLLVLEGNVHVDSERAALRCDRLEYDALEGRTSAWRADLYLDTGQGPNGWPLRIRAAELWEAPDGTLHAEDTSVTTCSSPDPHYEVKLEEIHGIPLGEDRWRWTTSGGSFAVDGSSLLPVPAPDFESGENYLGFTGFRAGSSNTLGPNVEIELSSAFQLGDSLDVAWRFQPGASAKRGFPLRGLFELEGENYEGQWDLFYLYDLGDNVHPFSAEIADNSKNRWRARMYNRFDLGDAFRLDADLAITSDGLVDPEFFDEEWWSFRDVFSELYLRRPGDNDFFDALFAYRLDGLGFTPIEGFGTPGSPNPQTLESLPRVRYEQLSTTVLDVPVPVLGGADGTAPLNLNWGAEAAILRLRDRDLKVPPGNPPYQPLPTLTRDRLRVWSELALPLFAGPVFLRPGVQGRANLYNEDLYGRSGADRETVEGYLETGLLMVRNYEHGWQHRVQPQIAYRYRAAGGTNLDDLVLFDVYDRDMTSGEVLEMGLRQFFYSPGASRPWMDLNLLMPYYPDSDNPLLDPLFPSTRPGDTTDSWGPLEMRLVWDPSVYGETLEGLRMSLHLRHDMADNRLDEMFWTLTARPDDSLTWGLNYRKVDDLFSIADIFFDWRFHEDWALNVALPYTFTGDGVRGQLIGVRHYAHDFMVEVGFNRDSSTGQEGVFFNFQPRFLVDTPPASLERPF